MARVVVRAPYPGLLGEDAGDGGSAPGSVTGILADYDDTVHNASAVVSYYTNLRGLYFILIIRSAWTVLYYSNSFYRTS